MLHTYINPRVMFFFKKTILITVNCNVSSKQKNIIRCQNEEYIFLSPKKSVHVVAIALKADKIGQTIIYLELPN